MILLVVFCSASDVCTNMSVDKEEYIESSVSLEGKYPQFTHEGDENADAVIRFEPQAAHRLEIAHSVTEDIGGELQLYFSQQGDKLAAICFRGAAKRWKFERYVFCAFPPLDNH